MTTELVVVLVFFALDFGFVIAALIWLSGRRALNDPTDLRKRDRNRRYQR